MRRLINIMIILILSNYGQSDLLAETIEVEDEMLIQQENKNKDWLDKPSGFLWYNEAVMQKVKKPQYLQSKLSSKETLEPHDQRIEHLKQQFDRAQRIALDNPTLENVIKAQRLQKIIMEKSQKFAAIWQLTTLMDSQLINPHEPVNSLHKRLYQEKIDQERFDKLQNLSKDWGLILQINNQCSYCHAFAPIVRQLTSKYGLQLLLVSHNGTNFQNMKTIKDTGLLRDLNPTGVTPILYLVSSNGKKIYPIARSLVSEDKIIENIMSIINMDAPNLALE